MRKHLRALTLIEFVAVAGILPVVLGAAVSSLARFRELNKRIVCSINLKGISAAVALAVLIGSTSVADVVTTSDGSRIVGNVVQIADGTLVILTEIAGKLEIDASKVTSISTDRSVHVAVESGDTLVGLMEASGGGSVVRSKLGDI